MYRFIILLLIFPPPCYASQLKLTVNSSLVPVLLPFFDDWFQEAGISYEFVPCSLARCIKILKNDNSIHGAAARRDGFEKKVSRLSSVGLPYGWLMLYGMNLHSKAWPPGLHDRISCVRGTYWCEDLIYNDVFWVNTHSQAELMLRKNRVEWALMTRLNYFPPPVGEWIYIDKAGSFLFLDKKLKDEIGRLTEAQTRLIESGKWHSMQEELRKKAALLGNSP